MAFEMTIFRFIADLNLLLDCDMSELEIFDFK
jgi:hypothetical protein